MPSAVPSKLSKQPSTVTSTGDTGPVQQSADASQAIEEVIKNKIRNLEKRKAKLNSYEADLKKGKELTEDQQEAVKHIGEVEQQLDSMKELLKSIQEIIKQGNKKLKADKKAEQKERVQTEIGRIRDLLRLQDILSSLGNDAVRKDFLNGSNGAIKLSESELQKLDELFQKFCPCHEDLTENQSWSNLLQEGSLVTYSLLTNSANPVPFYEGMTYRELRAMVEKIADCGYFNSKLGRSQSPEQAKSEAASTISNAEDNVRSGMVDGDDSQAVTDVGQHVAQAVNLTTFNGGSGGAAVITPASLIGKGGLTNISFLQDDQSGNYAATNFDPSAISASMPYQPASSALLFNQQQATIPSAQLSGYAQSFEQPILFTSGGNPSEQSVVPMKQLDPNAPTFVSQADVLYVTTIVPASSQVHKEAAAAQYFASAVDNQRVSQEFHSDENVPSDIANNGASQNQQQFGYNQRGRGGYRGGERGGSSTGRGGRGGGYRGNRGEGGQGGYRGRGGGYQSGYRNDGYSGQGRGGRGGAGGYGGRGARYDQPRGGRGANSGGFRTNRGGGVEA